MALRTVLPKLRAFGGTFLWRDEEFIVRDSAWVDMSTHEALVPYFYQQCLQPARKGSKSPLFKSKQFILMVVVPEGQWKEFENLQDESEAVCLRTVYKLHPG
jgi:hypothetical protein